MTGLCVSSLAYTVWLCVKQTMFFSVKNLPLAPQYRKRRLKINANSVRSIHNHAKVEKTSATCNNKRWLTWFVGNLHVLWGLKHGKGGWLLVIRTIFLSCKINWYFMVIYILRLYCFFKSFHPFSQHNKRNSDYTITKHSMWNSLLRNGQSVNRQQQFLTNSFLVTQPSEITFFAATGEYFKYIFPP